MRIALAIWALLILTTLVSAQERTTEAKLVKYDELAEIIRQNKGKVIVVDLWNINCIPCIQKFPELVELQNKHAAGGLVVITLNVDPGVTDPTDRATTLKFIQERLDGNNPSKTKVTLTNLILDEKPELAEKKLRFEGIVPCVFVFTREGKWWQFRFGAKKAEDEQKIKELIQEELKKK